MRANGAQLGEEKEGNGHASNQDARLWRPVGPLPTPDPRKAQPIKETKPRLSPGAKRTARGKYQNPADVGDEPHLPQGFSPDQLRKLVRNVDPKHLQVREFDGKRLTYIEGWYAIAQANAIFGHAGWDREMVHFERVMEKIRSDAIITCGYVARVRIRVRTGSTEVIREGTGWGSAAASTATAANERALKAAETDATKRALSTFGASFGLTLYDKDHVPIKPRPVFALFAPDGKLLDDALSPEAYSTGLRQLIEICKDTHQIDQLSHHNRASLVELRIQVPSLRNAQGVHFADLLLRLMQRRRERASTASIVKDSSPADASETSECTSTRLDVSTPLGEVPGVLAKARAASPLDGNGAEVGSTDIGLTNHSETAPGRTIIGPGDAFRRYTGQSSQRRSPYQFPGHSEIQVPKSPVAISVSLPSISEAKDVAPNETNLAAVSLAAPAAALLVTKVDHPGESPDQNRVFAEMLEPAPSKIAFGLRIDKSKLLLGLERRIRDKAHLRRVAELPCLVCNRQPSHAHHLRFAQRRGLSQKVSDEYVVPLCALHHGDLHRSSSEQQWWAKNRIDPVPISAELWLAHRRE